MKLAMIEDDKTISYAVQKYLSIYEMETIIFGDLSSSENIKFDEFDLIILDANLPDGSGFDYLKWLRDFSQIPVIMLTVKDDEEYIVKGLSTGADDYITKPFSLPVLKARIDNIFRRKDLLSQKLNFKELSIDLTSKTARINNKDLELNLREFSILEIFLENKDVNLTRENIISYVWGYDFYEINDNTLSVTIKRLRNKLGQYGNHIKTNRGLGYMWESEADEKI